MNLDNDIRLSWIIEFDKIALDYYILERDFEFKRDTRLWNVM